MRKSYTFLHRENVKAAIKEYLKEPNESDFLKSLTDEFIASFYVKFSSERANSIIIDFFKILDDEIEENKVLRENRHFFMDKKTHEVAIKTNELAKETLKRVNEICESQIKREELKETVESFRMTDEHKHIFKYTERLFEKICEECGKKDKKILIIGDVTLHHKIKGTAAKYEDVQKHHMHLNGEGVYMASDETKTPGGAADIAVAFSKISSVTLIGVIGSDCEGNTLKKICEEHNIQCYLDQKSEVKTTTKIYIHRLTENGARKVIRFDSEDIRSMTKYCQNEDVRKKLNSEIEKFATETDCIVIKDHQKGMISKELINEIAKVASDKGKPVYVDPRYSWQIFDDVTIEAILPNIKEVASALYDIKKEEGKILEKDLNCKLEKAEYDKVVRDYPKCKNFVIKAASKGAVILSQNPDVCPKEINPFLVEERKLINPFFVEKKDFETDVGCGVIFDVFMIIGMLNKHTIVESALFANFVAGLKRKNH